MHELSFVTWVIHISSVLEWVLAIFIVNQIASYQKYKYFFWFGLAMIPNLVGAMCAITWHIYDNPVQLYGLVTLQGVFTTLGNSTLAVASFHLYKNSSNYE